MWKALFLREAVSRLAAERGAWVWLLLEPLSHLIFLMALYHVVFHRVTGGVDSAMFTSTGVLAFLTVRNTALRSMDAVDANTALFAYRQVLAVDTVLVRAALEGFLMLLVSVTLLAGTSLFGFSVVPNDILGAIAAFGMLWLSGLGIALIFSVARELTPEMSKIGKMLFSPLYFFSGVMVPAMTVPQPYREWLFYNPILHGIELLHASFFQQFHPAPEASMGYLAGFTLLTLFFGLALQVRFARRMVAQ